MVLIPPHQSDLGGDWARLKLNHYNALRSSLVGALMQVDDKQALAASLAWRCEKESQIVQKRTNVFKPADRLPVTLGKRLIQKDHWFVDYRQMQSGSAICLKHDVDLDWIQRNLEPHQAIVRYFQGEREVLAWWISSEQVAAFKVAGLDKFKSELDAAARALSSRSGDLQSLRMLRKMLLPDLPASDIKSLQIIADGLLANVPYAALDLAATGRYQPIVSRITITRSGVPQSFAEKIVPATSTIFANPDYSKLAETTEAAMQLPNTAWEARLIQEVLPQSRSFEGSSATPDALLNIANWSDGWTHIAMHGLIDPQFPRFSGLLMTPSPNTESFGFVSGFQLEAMNLVGRSVFLSACDTAVGEALTAARIPDWRNDSPTLVPIRSSHPGGV